VTHQPLALIIFLLAITAVACDGSTDPTGNAAMPGETTDGVRSNADLENAVITKLKADEQLRSADLRVSADSPNHEITLSGSVESEALRSKAVDLARSVDSGVSVTDQIEVKPSGRNAENVLRNPQQHHG